MLKQREIKKALLILNKTYHERTTALNFKTPFELLISTILSAQTTDKQVNKAEDMCKQVSKGKMPPKSFRSNNPDKVPTQAEVQVICNWASSLEAGDK